MQCARGSIVRNGVYVLLFYGFINVVTFHGENVFCFFSMVTQVVTFHGLESRAGLVLIEKTINQGD